MVLISGAGFMVWGLGVGGMGFALFHVYIYICTHIVVCMHKRYTCA